MKKAINQSALTLILNCTSILLVLFSMFSFALILQSNNAVNIGNTNRYNLTYNATRFMNGSAYLTNEVRAYSATGDIVHYDNYWNELNELKNRDIGVEALRSIGITPEEDALIKDMAALSNNLVPLEESAMKLTADGNTAEALNSVYGKEYEQGIAKIKELQTKFLSMLDIRSEQAVQIQMNKASQLTVLMFVCLFLTAAIQVFSFIIIRLRVIKPIVAIKDEMLQISQSNLSAEFSQEPDTSEIGTLVASIIDTKTELKRYIGDVSDKLKALSDGDMTIDMDIDYMGEFSSIKTSMLTILASFNEVLAEINHSSTQIADGSRQMAEGAQSLSQGSIEQSGSVEHLSGSINDISLKVENTTQAVMDAQSKAGEASEELISSNEKMQQMMQAMEHISHTSEEIKKIVKTVSAIAFQTNILALNAAVEAARAGAAGKGFAVVADEVRNLANKSSQAADSSTEFINQSVQAVANGTAAAQETALSLKNVTELAGVIVTTLDKISDASVAQSKEISSINQDVENITNIVRTNSATAEESAAASEELSGQAMLLKESISRFRLKKTPNKNAHLPSSVPEHSDAEESALALF